jgi:sortase A
MPGERGNAAIVGRRTTYGAPFADLDQLRAGDRVIVTTPRGAFRYKIAEKPFTVSDDTDHDPYEPALGNRLTLVTSSPALLASERLVARGELLGDAIPPPALNDRGGSIDAADDGLSPNWSAIPGVLVWAQILLLAFGFAFVLYRRWLRWPTYLLTTPVLIALLILTFDAFSKLLPSSL